MITITKPAGYTYKAENYCSLAAAWHYLGDNPHPLLGQDSMQEIHALGGDPFSLLADIASERGLDLSDLSNYDSDEFPKPFTAEQAAPEEFCGHCLMRFRDGVQLKPYTVLGLEFPDGTHMACHVLPGYVPDTMVAAAGNADGYERWTSHVTAENQHRAVAKALALATDGVEEESEPLEVDYGTEVVIGDHRITSWGARAEDGRPINYPAVQIEYLGVEVMVYSSVLDGRTVVETTRTGNVDYRVVADDTDPVYVNYGPRSED